MPRRLRTAKKLAKRINLQYFERLHPWRRWRLIVSLAVPVAALLWIAWAGAARKQQIYSNGLMSPAHAVFGVKCDACHVLQVGAFRRRADDQACLACHDGPVHHVNQVYTPRCADCHTEHQARVKLAQTRDTNCTQCHADLRTKNGPPAFARDVEGFNQRHPQFAPLRPGYKDPGKIKLNHAVHLKADLRGPEGHMVQLVCADCHRAPAVRAPWQYGTPEFRTVAAHGTQDLLATEQTRAYLAPPQYAKACALCHPLMFDARFTIQAPHDTPEVVHAFVVKKFEEYIASHPAELSNVTQPARRLSQKPFPRAARALTRQEWVTERTAESEDLLWRKTCKECHTLSFFSANALPAVAKSAITVRWLPHAVFDHEAHRMLDCASCHPGALTSQETSDVLVPGIETCRQCHHSGSEGAEARCFECHEYHDWSKRKEVRGKFTIPELLRRSSTPAERARGRADASQ